MIRNVHSSVHYRLKRTDSIDVERSPELMQRQNFPQAKGVLRKIAVGSNSPASATPGTSYNEHKPKTPPPDLPSLLLDSRIIYIGMPVKISLSFVFGSLKF